MVLYPNKLPESERVCSGICNSSNGGNKEHVEVITDEVTRIKKNIDIIHDSHMSNSKKREAYLDFDKELIEVLSLITRLNNINKTIMSHE